MSQQRLRVAIASERPVIRLGLAAMLQDASHRVDLVDPGVPSSRPEGPDVVVYDATGLLDDVVRDLSELVSAHAAVVAVALPGRTAHAEAARSAGAAATVTADAQPQELWDVLVAISGAAVARGAATGLPGVLGPGAAAARTEVSLTRREEEVVTLIARGLSNQELAGELYLSVNSVKTYIRAAYRKMGVSSRSQAVKWALQHGLS